MQALLVHGAQEALEHRWDTTDGSARAHLLISLHRGESPAFL
jgi:hypothetical protein